MGNPVFTGYCSPQPALPAKPVFDDDKWYFITVDAFFDAGLAGDCTMAKVATLTACRIGSAINTFLDLGYECNFPAELIYYGEITAQRLVNTNGPYDSEAACCAANP